MPEADFSRQSGILETMGVKNLWTLLSDDCENDIDISSLHGKTLAVDLSYWICELTKKPIAEKISNLLLV